MNTNNVINLVGRLSSDIKVSESGKMISFGFAVSRTKEITDFFNCKCFKKERVEFIQKYFKKGGLAQIVGSVQIDKVENPAGIKYFTNIIVEDIGFLPFNKSDEKQDPLVQSCSHGSRIINPNPIEQAPEIKESEFDFGDALEKTGIGHDVPF